MKELKIVSTWYYNHALGKGEMRYGVIIDGVPLQEYTLEELEAFLKGVGFVR